MAQVNGTKNTARAETWIIQKMETERVAPQERWVMKGSIV